MCGKENSLPQLKKGVALCGKNAAFRFRWPEIITMLSVRNQICFIRLIQKAEQTSSDHCEHSCHYTDIGVCVCMCVCVYFHSTNMSTVLLIALWTWVSLLLPVFETLASGSLSLLSLIQQENSGCQAKVLSWNTAAAAQTLSATWHAYGDVIPVNLRFSFFYFWFPGANHILKTVNGKLLN